MSRENKASRFSNAFNPVKTAPELYDTYDFVPSFTVATATTDYNLKTQQATSFLNVPAAWMCILWTDQDISIKLNSTSNPAITVIAGESPWELRDIIKITNIFITNASGSTANIKAMLV